MSLRTVTTTLDFAELARQGLTAHAPRCVRPCAAEPLSGAVGYATNREVSSRASGDDPEPSSRLPVERPRWGWWALVLCAGCGGSAGEAPIASAPSPMLGATSQFELPSNEGALVSVPQPNAKVTVIDAFAPTCEPCAKKLPALVAQRSALAEAGAKLVLIAVLADGESDDAAKTALHTWGADSPFLIDRGDVLRRELAIDKLPGTVVVDVAGKIRWVAPPDATAEDIVAAARSAAIAR